MKLRIWWMQIKRVSRRRALIHCWADGGESTCLRLDGHIGRHKWTPDSEIFLDFEETK